MVAILKIVSPKKYPEFYLFFHSLFLPYCEVLPIVQTFDMFGNREYAL